MKSNLLVCLYLCVIVLANLLVNKYGPTSVYIVGFIFIGLDLFLRDSIHDIWHNKQLKVKMLGLFVAGGMLSYLVNRSAVRIALASSTAFIVSAVVDYIIYEKLYKHNKLIKMNFSNAVSVFIDSFVFLSIAFGFPPLLFFVLKQYMVKMLGGVVWGILIIRMK